MVAPNNFSTRGRCILIRSSAVMPTAVHQRYDEEGDCPDFPMPFLFVIERIIRADLVVMAHLNVQSMRVKRVISLSFSSRLEQTPMWTF